MFILIKVNANYDTSVIKMFEEEMKAKSNLLSHIKLGSKIHIKLINDMEVDIYKKTYGFVYNNYTFYCKFKILDSDRLTVMQKKDLDELTELEEMRDKYL